MDHRGLVARAVLVAVAMLACRAPAAPLDRAQVLGNSTARWSGSADLADGGWAGGNATTGVGGGTFDLNAFLGASRYYTAGVTGQNTVAFNLEAGHFWNGHETLSHVVSNTTNFVNASSTFGSGSIAPLYDRHATAVAMLIGGRPTAVNPDVRQQGLAPGTTLRSAAIATGWSGSAYALSFNISGSTYVDAFDGAFGTGQVVNSSYGYSDPAGTNVFTIFSDGMSWANPGTLHVVSAGNSGPSANTVGAPGSGYNTLTVASLGSANAFNSASGFSSRGPQDFGYVNAASAVVTVAGARAPVDLAAPGESIRSAFYGGQTGGNNTSLAGSTDLGSNAAAYADVNGTSFAAPIVAGGATLVASAARTLAPLAANADAAQSVVVKSLLMTGADKTSGWSNGQTSVIVGGTTYLKTTQALDQAVGAGRMNLDSTYTVQVTGQTDVLGTGTGVIGSVQGTGWDYGTAVRTVSNDYLLPLLSGSTAFTATLSWLRNRDAITDVLDVAQADLNLSLWQLDGTGAFTTLVARSESLYNTSEHLFLSLPAEARYGLRIEYPLNTFDNTVGGVWGTAANPQPYGLSWMGTVVPVPEPATWALALTGAGAALMLRRRARRRGAGPKAARAAAGTTGDDTLPRNPSMSRIPRSLIALLAAVGAVAGMDAARAADKPNIVIILADDLGNADLGYRGSAIKTPHIDALAKGGVRLESYYGLPLCTPARAALLTGRYPMRHGLQTLVIFPGHRYGLPTDEKTLPQALKEVGYRTNMVGKWHLGHADRKYWPNQRGFDHFYGNVVGEVDYFTKDRGGVIDWQRDGTFLQETGYYTEQIGDEAVSVIGKHDPSKPLFLYVASLAPHAPYQAPPADVAAYEGVFADKARREYAAMITALDTQVGRIVAALEQKGMRGNTLIFFTSDNGGATSALFATGARSPEEREASGGVALGAQPPASNAPFSGGKGTLREGGVRLPAIVNWPGTIAPGVVNEPLHHVDVMPTLLALVGGTGDPAKPFDGRDATATIVDGKPSPNDDILINVEAFRGAIRRGKWKLLRVALLPGKTELFDLEADPGEKVNVADEHPDVVQDLEARLLAYARQQKPSEWLKTQTDFLGFQGETVLDPGYNVDRGLPTEKPALPRE